MALDKVLYTATATATGGRTGTAQSSDGALKVDLSTPRELGGMGQSNALLRRRHGPLRRATVTTACTLYRERFGDAEGRVPATFDILFLTAWKPHASQPRPLPRGSGKVSLAEHLAVPARDPADEG